MYIVNQRRDTVVNLNSMQAINLADNEILIGDIIRMTILAEYKTEDRAKEVFEQMLRDIFPQEVIIFQNMEVDKIIVDEFVKNRKIGIIARTDNDIPKIERIEPRVYYMPEE